MGNFEELYERGIQAIENQDFDELESVVRDPAFDPKAMDEFSNDPSLIRYAIEYHSPEAVEILLAAGFSPDFLYDAYTPFVLALLEVMAEDPNSEEVLQVFLRDRDLNKAVNYDLRERDIIFDGEGRLCLSPLRLVMHPEFQYDYELFHVAHSPTGLDIVKELVTRATTETVGIPLLLGWRLKTRPD